MTLPLTDCCDPHDYKKVGNMKYPINDIYRTIQGEGALAGTPMILIRLQGCDVGCPWCDTKETWETRGEDSVESFEALHSYKRPNRKYFLATPREIAREIKRIKSGSAINWVLITGGEPCLFDLYDLVCEVPDGMNIALETSGTEEIEDLFDWVCVSPKFDMPGGKKVEIPEWIDEIKHVIGKQADIDRLIEALRGRDVDPEKIRVAPVSQSSKALVFCIDACYSFGWNLSIQLHKYIGVP